MAELKKLWHTYIHTPIAVLIGMSMMLRLSAELLLLALIVLYAPGISLPMLTADYPISLPLYVWMLFGCLIEYCFAKWLIIGWRR